MIKYEKEINNLLREIIYEPWMDEEDYERVIFDVFNELNITKEKLSNDIEIGVQNGYSPEVQFQIVNHILKNKT